MTRNLSPCKHRLNDLRRELRRSGLDGFIVPHTDAYGNEFLPASEERLAWLTGFTGSAGMAGVLMDKAVTLSDGRYTIQLAQQVDPDLFETGDSTKTTIAAWLAEQAAEGQVIGYDPWLHTASDIKAMQETLGKKKIVLKAVAGNPLDAVWTDRPAAPAGPVEVFPEAVAGRSAAEKIDDIVRAVREEGACAVILSRPDCVAWLLNIRGDDTPNTPLALSRVIVYADGTAEWFVDSGRLSPDLGLPDALTVRPPQDLETAITVLGDVDKPVWLDRKSTPIWFETKLKESGADVLNRRDPCLKPRAVKTGAEQNAMRSAHITDGVAIVRFLHWLDTEGGKGNQDELSVMDRLEAFRATDPAYRGPSFTTIAGFGPNGAIVHYRAEEETNRRLVSPGLLLVDSGGQYRSDTMAGTTDITRTVAIGEPSEEMRRHFTLVLKGHIAVARARFPENASGAQIDALARRALWDAGLDYAHGTGHGVGCYLSVHEDAPSISPRTAESPLPGMILSNEPGYYLEGQYGIRIENLVLVREKDESGMLSFETITLAPIDRHLVVPEMLDAAERDWLNAYHARVYETLAPLLEPGVAAWLKAACAPL